MEFYDPLQDPDPDEWLAIDEDEQVLLVADYHEEEGLDLPNMQLHASIHAAIESQLAMGDPPQVLSTLTRLLDGGLDRREAIHAIGSCLSEQMFNVVKDPSKNVNPTEAYVKSLDNLTAAKWFLSGEE